MQRPVVDNFANGGNWHEHTTLALIREMARIAINEEDGCSNIHDVDVLKQATQVQLAEQKVRGDLFAMVERHRLEVVFGDSTQIRIIDQNLYARCREAGYQGQLLSLAVAAETKKLSVALTSADIRVMVIKGLALSFQTTGSISKRGSGDIDLFVSPEDLESAVRVIEEEGYARLTNLYPQRLGDTKERYCRWIHNQLELVKETNDHIFYIDLHWSLSKHRGELPSFTQAWHNREKIRLGTVQINTLSIHDAFRHACVHAASDRWMSIRNLIDIHRLSILLTRSHVTTRLESTRAVALSAAVAYDLTKSTSLLRFTSINAPMCVKAMLMAKKAQNCKWRELEEGGKGLIEWIRKVRFHQGLTGSLQDKLRILSFFVLPPRRLTALEQKIAGQHKIHLDDSSVVN